MSPGLFAPGRVDDADSGQAHSQTHEDPAREFRGDRAHGRRGRVIEQNGEQAGGDHEKAKLDGLHEVLGPMALQSLFHGERQTVGMTNDEMSAGLPGLRCGRLR